MSVSGLYRLLAAEADMAKFVRLMDAGGSTVYRFCGMWRDHDSLVCAGEVPLSAGFVVLKRNKVRVMQGSSLSLSLGPDPADEGAISALVRQLRESK